MAEPWFRRWMGFGYVPINWQGWSVLVVMIVTFVPSAALFVILGDVDPAVSWLCALVAVMSALIGHAIVFCNLERTYGS